MRTYPFNAITINGREVEINHILNSSASPLSKFETETFSFIQKWFSTTEKFIQNTSGSTGTPKKITITRQQMIASAQLTERALKLKAGEIALVCLDPEYIAGKMMLVRSFVTGMRIVAINPSLNPFRELSSDISVDFTALVPSQLYALIKSTEAIRLNTVKSIIVGGAALNREVHKQVAKFKCQIYASYGMTETISHIALQRVNGKKASEYFSVMPDIKIDTDKRGCLEIDANFLEKKITTNDLVEILDASHFKWLGRVDNIINSGGIKIIPEKVEAKIQRIVEDLEIGNRFLISSLEDPQLGNKVILLVDGVIEQNVLERFKSRIKRTLSSYEAPKELYSKVNFVLTENGKINRLITTQNLENQKNQYIKNYI